MAKEPKVKSGGKEAREAEPEAAATTAKVVGQYIKDLSFENPSITRLLDSPGDSPNISLEVNVNAKRMTKPEFYESAISLRAQATNKTGTLYIFECEYAGLFHLQNIPEQALEPFLLINCPALIFPFLRRLAADVTREGGFPPLLIDPLDFAGLYMHRQQQASEATRKTLS